MSNLASKIAYVGLLTLACVFAFIGDYSHATFDLILAIWLDWKTGHRTRRR